MVKTRKDRAARAEGQFPSCTFVFRGNDLSAVHEVLLDREYTFLGPVLHGLSEPILIDAGAHIGLFSLWVLSERPESRILSIEADPRTYAVLCETTERSKERVSYWQAVNRATWRDGTPVRFTDAGQAMSHRVSESGTITVKGVTLGELIDKVAPDREIDLLKVDIEGTEEAFLSANPDTLARVENLVIELHPKLCKASRVEMLLRSSFGSVERINVRTSSKPLLLCSD